MRSKAWKLSASVIIALRSPIVRDTLMKAESIRNRSQSDSKYDRDNLQILSLRRGETDKHLPGIHVFPGGHMDEADMSSAWLDLYRSLGYEENSFASISTGGCIEHLPEYNEENTSCLPGWMSFRLCAIRETFEESGILLCRSPSATDQGLPYASFTILHELTAWQNRVRADPRQMLALCHAAGCVPDVWGLHLWENWLTPTQQKIRHNSVFFLAALRSLPSYSLNKAEMDELNCCSPLELLDLACDGKIRLANPQFYEALRLKNFSSTDDLASFAHKRAKLGCVCNMPVQEKTRNGMLFLLPGDSAYPTKVDIETSRELSKREESLEELQEKVRNTSGTLHRIEIPGKSCQRVITSNYIPSCQHVLPLTDNFNSDKTKSHL